MIERRTWLKGLAAGVAGTVAAGTSVEAAAPAAPANDQAPSSSPSRFLDDHLRKTLASVAEVLVPGSGAAGAIDLIDRATGVDAPARQRRLLNAVARFDQEAQSAHGKRWIDLTPAEQRGLMTRISQLPRGERDHFNDLRTTVINAYMATEAGMKEFGWAGRNAWQEPAKCAHPEGAHE